MNADPGAPSRVPARRPALTLGLACALAAGAGVLAACSDQPVAPGARRAEPGGGPSRALYNNPLCQVPAGQTHPADTITTTEQWYPSGNPHWVTGDIRVENGAQLRIHAGAVVCFDQFVQVVADAGAHLAVDGDDTARVVLTALHPDHGWDGVSLYGTPAAASFARHAVIEYARGGAAVFATDHHTVVLDSVHIRQSGNAALLYSPGSRILYSVVDTIAQVAVVLSDSTRFTRTTVRGAGWGGVHVVAQSGVQLMGGRIEGSTLTGLVVENEGAVYLGQPIRITGGGSYPVDVPVDVLARMYNTPEEHDSLTGNARDTAYIRGGTVHRAVHAAAALPWRVTQPVVVDSGGSLRARPGASIAFDGARGITARNGGRVLARGSAAAPVRMTASDPVAGWEGILLEGVPPGNSYVTNARLEHVSGAYSAVFARDSHLVYIDSTVFRQVSQAAALASPGSRIARSRIDTTTVTGKAAVELAANGRLESTLIRGAADTGILLATSTTRVISCEVRESGGDGIVLSSSLTSANAVNDCNLVDNGGSGIVWWHSSTLDATDNWWGDAAGPTGANGDGVFGTVDYTPWRTTPYVLPYVP
ncbi:MAG TPA: right-handed parallel beta-helix repeat-containing protein [Longimicrobium sp.]|nr:right-handed parallel beta-helix repeat-containing protein [Longimicrobium sp.]